MQGYMCDRCNKAVDRPGFVEDLWLTLSVGEDVFHYCSFGCLKDGVEDFLTPDDVD